MIRIAMTNGWKRPRGSFQVADRSLRKQEAVKGDQGGAFRLRIEACVSKLSARPLADRRQI
ncbi:hypothetical protein EFK98_10275 [Lactococcus cremoris]|uniref:Uncharacterized protein n=1 Tax=Lactococcus cremoris subsp. cremoris IBB477 TaxID=1449093 RepID=A0A1E7G3Y3_LACLC|nr:hypothetical protein [Lactococcus cremoris]OEU39675.1 hypothetical protein AJ89_07250 [Lactococcus cremoris subsp. cremoris IBB477]MCT0475140.1 hypothetical protein [Lactococcus cremoris]MCT0477237.1 hypothetical protein [Lactococcus cremoris]MCT0511754.1 hypothetical protein [Lactococcus cremoris]